MGTIPTIEDEKFSKISKKVLLKDLKKKDAKTEEEKAKLKEDVEKILAAEEEREKKHIEESKKDLAQKHINFKKDCFARPSYLTVSGQLSVECFTSGLSDCYTFGPTFRAENSHTPRHAAEFWMIEPEMAFAGMEENIANA